MRYKIRRALLIDQCNRLEQQRFTIASPQRQEQITSISPYRSSRDLHRVPHMRAKGVHRKHLSSHTFHARSIMATAHCTFLSVAQVKNKNITLIFLPSMQHLWSRVISLLDQPVTQQVNELSTTLVHVGLQSDGLGRMATSIPLKGYEPAVQLMNQYALAQSDAARTTPSTISSSTCPASERATATLPTSARYEETSDECQVPPHNRETDCEDHAKGTPVRKGLVRMRGTSTQNCVE